MEQQTKLEQTVVPENTSELVSTVSNATSVHRRPKNKLLQYYEEYQPNYVRCKICKSFGINSCFSIKRYLYNNAELHLKKVHKIQLHTKKPKSFRRAQKRRDGTQDHIFDMVCNFGVPIKAIKQSVFFEEAFKVLGLDSNWSEDIFIEKAMEIKENTIKEISGLQELKEKFSLTFDTVSVKPGKRLMNLRLHSCNKEIKNLGLLFLQDHMSDYTINRQVLLRLSDYGIDLNAEIIAVCASCSAFNLRVLNAFDKPYVNCVTYELHRAMFELIFENDEELDLAYELKKEEDGYPDWDEQMPTGRDFMYRQVSELVPKIRAIILRVKNDQMLTREVGRVMQQKCKNGLELDCGTRWSSLYSMLVNFSVLLEDLEAIMQASLLTVEEKMLMCQIIEVIRPLQHCLHYTCQEKASIENVLSLMKSFTDHLKHYPSEFASCLMGKVNVIFSHFISAGPVLITWYLSGGQSLDTLTSAKKQVIESTIISFSKTNFKELPGYWPIKKVSLSHKFYAISKGLTFSQVKAASSQVKIEEDLEERIRSEMTEYETTGNKSMLLVAIERAVSSIPVSASACSLSLGEANERVMTDPSISIQMLDSLCLIGRYEKPSQVLSVYEMENEDPTAPLS